MDIKTKLNLLADKYENAAFLEKDPSQFLYRYSDEADIEVASFIAALFSFGSRTQFIPKISLDRKSVV